MNKKIIFQGERGANSHIACMDAYPDYEILPKATFSDCFSAMNKGEAELAMIPVENSVAGRVADVHHYLPEAGLYIIGEYFLPIHHQLLGIKGTKLSDVKEVQSHVMALGQCRNMISSQGFIPIVGADTAGSAREIKEMNQKHRAAIATRLAAEVYDLEIISENIEDEAHNTTRFLILSRTPLPIKAGDCPHIITSLIFKVGNIPAALYKCLGGFATNKVNVTKLESYQIQGRFQATQFYADIEGHPDDPAVKNALEELAFFTENKAGAKIIGVYPAAILRD